MHENEKDNTGQKQTRVSIICKFIVEYLLWDCIKIYVENGSPCILFVLLDI